MKLTNKILIASYFLIAAAFPASNSDQAFSVTLHPPSSPLKSGSEVRLKATVANISDHEIRFARSLGLREEEFDYEIEVRDARGQAPPLTPTFLHLKENPTSRWCSYMTYVLDPGKSFDDELVITNLYVLTAPGEYVIRVERARRPIWQISDKDQRKSSVKSNAITITITR